MHERDRWWESAVCAQVGLRVFFPDIGNNATTAKRICATCPVRLECLAEEIQYSTPGEGIFAGFGRDPRADMHLRVLAGSDPIQVAALAIQRDKRKKKSHEPVPA